MKNSRSQKGFTLLEMILVLGILVIILPLGFSIFLATSRAQVKVYVLQNAKRNGDTAMAIMQNLIKTRAVSLQQQDGTSVCVTAPSTFSASDIYFVDSDSSRFRFYLDQNKIASESSVIGSTHLTNDAVSVQSFTMTCERESLFSPPLISVSYTVTQANSTRRAEEQAQLDYQTKIRLRTY